MLRLLAPGYFSTTFLLLLNVLLVNEELLCFVCFETDSLYVAQNGLEFKEVYLLYFLSALLKGVCPFIQAELVKLGVNCLPAPFKAVEAR